MGLPKVDDMSKIRASTKSEIEVAEQRLSAFERRHFYTIVIGAGSSGRRVQAEYEQLKRDLTEKKARIARVAGRIP